MKKILRNAIRCNKCGEVIVSESVHDFVTCKCGACAVDGGHDYLRRCVPSQDAYTELSEVEEQKTKIEVVAALIWDKEKFLICQRPTNKARGL